MAIGVTVGLASIHAGAVTFSLGTSAAVLITGLFVGWLNSRHHTLGEYDPAAAEVVKDLGLSIFIGCTALIAAPGAFAFFRKYGFVVPATSALTVLVAASASMLICRRFLRMQPLRMLGVLAGQQSSSPTMSALQQRFSSTQPLLTYVPIYAISTLLGPVLMPAVIQLISAATAH